MPTAPDPNNSIKRFSTTATVYPHLPDAQVGDSVHTTTDFGTPVTITCNIQPVRDPEQFAPGDLGEQERGGERLRCSVPKSETGKVDADDSLDWDGRAWRLTERQFARYSDFERYVLVPDNRRTHGSQT